MLNIFTRIFGSRNQRLLRQYAERVRQANAFADALAAESDERLRARTDKLRARLVAGETLDDILPEAFATAREAATRAVGLRPFDVQLVGGMVLHDGKISEMRTGEGKTLVATLPVYLNALAGQGRARRHRQRVPRPARRRVDGPDLPLARPLGRRDHERPVAGRQARRLRLRRDLRHQQRVRLRLPARQPRGPPRGPRAARPALRDRGRGGLDPDRRGADAAHHLGPGRGEHRAVREDQRARPALHAAGRPKRARATSSPTRSRARCTCPSPASRRPRS